MRVSPNTAWRWASPLFHLVIQIFLHSNSKTPRARWSFFFPKSVILTVRSRSEEDLLVSWIAEFEISIFTQFFLHINSETPGVSLSAFFSKLADSMAATTKENVPCHCESRCHRCKEMPYFIWCNHREEIERITKQFHNALKYVIQILSRNVEDCKFWCSDIWIGDAEFTSKLRSCTA